MDEAMSSVKLKSISKPVELDILEKEIRTLKIELEAKKSEKNIWKDILDSLENQISDKSKESELIEKTWKNEKEILNNIKNSRSKIDEFKIKADIFEREWNLWEVARIRYSEIPSLEKIIIENESKIKDLEEKWETYLKDRVDSNDIAEIIAKWTWIPAQKLLETEKEKLLKLEEVLKKDVIWQDEALSSISSAIRRARAWLSEEWKPLGSFLFLWPTWVGKTETAKALAKNMFDDEKNMIRIDMSEYMEKHSVSRLIWAPPWYIWHDEWGQLTEAVRRKPYSVILFDEVEKAHKDVFNILLQVLDDWRLTDSKWRVINFSNTIIILTSNIWSHKIQNLTKENKNNIEILSNLEVDLKQHFRPEFLNRLDDIIVFNPLSEDEIINIVDNILNDLILLLNKKSIKADFTINLKKHLASVWFDRDYWARPLKRIINNKVVNYLSNNILSWNINSWDEILLDLDYKKNITHKKSS